MAKRPSATALGTNNSINRSVSYIGHCVACKHGIFSDQRHGRAKLPLLGAAHEWCGGTPDSSEETS